MSLFELLFWSLVTWRITVLLVYDTISAPLRDWIGVKYDEHSQPYGKNFFARMLICHKCTSVWVGLGVVVAFFWPPHAIILIPYTLAFSAGAIVINRLVNGE